MHATVPSRLDDMLNIYGDRQVERFLEEQRQLGMTPTKISTRQARRRGECRGFVIHDSYFVWNRPVSNSFEELRQFVCAGQAEYLPRTINNWKELERITIEVAAEFLDRHSGMVVHPVLLPKDREIQWWQYMATIFECCRQQGELAYDPTLYPNER